jgi:hypothetical protein
MKIEKIVEFLAYITFALGVLGLGVIVSALLLIIGWVAGLDLYSAIVFAIAGGIMSGGLMSPYLYKKLFLPLRQPLNESNMAYSR